MKSPDYVYKYRCWDDEHHRRIITHGEIYFTSAASFNDPFDCSIPIQYTLMSKEEMLKYFKNTNGYSNQEIESLIASLIKSGEENINNIQREHNKDQIEYIRNKLGIFSVSEINNNILMWSHYSDSHEGFCVEFDAIKLGKYFSYFSEKNDFQIERHPAIYRESFPNLISEYDNNPIIKQLTTKASDWEYEKEVRYIIRNKRDMDLNNVDRLHFLENGIITRIILGCQMELKYKIEIAKILRSKYQQIDLLQAKKCENSFELKFEKWDY